MVSLELSRNAQRVICMLVATAIVAVSLAYGAIRSQPGTHKSYTVTISELGAELGAEVGADLPAGK